jgi:hypothetical protein
MKCWEIGNYYGVGSPTGIRDNRIRERYARVAGDKIRIQSTQKMVLLMRYKVRPAGRWSPRVLAPREAQIE